MHWYRYNIGPFFFNPESSVNVRFCIQLHPIYRSQSSRSTVPSQSLCSTRTWWYLHCVYLSDKLPIFAHAVHSLITLCVWLIDRWERERVGGVSWSIYSYIFAMCILFMVIAVFHLLSADLSHSLYVHYPYNLYWTNNRKPHQQTWLVLYEKVSSMHSNTISSTHKTWQFLFHVWLNPFGT